MSKASSLEYTATTTNIYMHTNVTISSIGEINTSIYTNTNTDISTMFVPMLILLSMLMLMQKVMLASILQTGALTKNECKYWDEHG